MYLPDIELDYAAMTALSTVAQTILSTNELERIDMSRLYSD